ncbi:nucleotide exchange factor GrpE [Pelodictyon luteolum]|uniref:Protein GrpE n=1 Tax=Chlorobium luteolum (strain DSM 273 / BCRC 81028 / 2530) TaxID=319225 RepID=GRPE_CHLL3|nr:nucleotide exchange factor GrpE [Pelodictyon luteolum]Q3B2T4.1 RecName: Full=Protein GrpE; AltName: Full=HSP-70 cofactor [Pelodictyon luteolum DSM 273]ABB24347.1 GrpE protein [Pelodictyon luteolum DSM 273]
MMKKAEDPLQDREGTIQEHTEGQAGTAAADQSAAVETPESRIAGLEREVQAEKEQNGKFRDELLRRAAEFENFRKQKEREAVMASQRATDNVLRDLLTLVDDVERVLANVPEPEEIPAAAKPYIDGVELLKKNLDRWLESKGVKPIEAIGMKLDVDFHEAISQIEHPDAEPETIVEQYQTGYLLGDRVLRHAKVIVAR